MNTDWEKYATQTLGMKHQKVCSQMTCVCEISDIGEYINVKLAAARKEGAESIVKLINQANDAIPVEDHPLSRFGHNTLGAVLEEARHITDTP